ncbi:MAG: acetate--CoA ligase family protein, partial [Gammaproteobacteria bacterium]|nr:acetate--CoA ligase family protein [Gammaproteobacteria bacterium]
MSARELSRALFSPRAVALVGASGDPDKNTGRPLRYLRQHGFRGRIVAINARRAEVMGERAYASVADAPGPIDHAFIMVPGAQVAEVIDQCAAAGIPVATVYSDGFAEAGEAGRARQAELLARARAGGVRLIGPNSMGVLNTTEPLALTINAALETPRLLAGRLSVVSQSGSVMGALLSRAQARGMGFAKAVSIGNEADVSVGELVELLVDDPDTDAILLFVESLRHAPALAHGARRAFAAGKPVVAFKLGHSRVGQSLAASHSGAITGGAATASAFFRAHGVLEVRMLESLLELPALVRGHVPPGGRRAAVLTTTGGGAAMVVDRLGLDAVEVVPAPPSVVRVLAEQGIRAPGSALVDLTMAGARGPVYRAALDALLASDGVDVVAAVVGSSGEHRPEVAVAPIIECRRTKPLAVFITPQADESLARLAQAGVAGFRTPEACADGVRAFLEWRAPAPEPPLARDLSAVQKELTSLAGRRCNEAQAARVFAALGIEQAPAAVVASAEDAHHLRYPVAVKLLSGEIGHKTELGGVVLGVAGARALADACRDIARRVHDRFGAQRAAQTMDGFLVQEMQTGVGEALVGYRDDAEVGPTVVVASGGTLVEIYADAAVRVAPVDLDEARRMIDEVKGLVTLAGFRSARAGDR